MEPMAGRFIDILCDYSLQQPLWCATTIYQVVQPCRWLLRHFGDTSSGVLALCMGSGSDVLAALLEGFDVVGVDYSTTMFNAARARVEAFASTQKDLLTIAMELALQDVTASDYLQQGLKAEQDALAEQQEDEQARLQLISETRKFLSDAAKLVGDGEEAQEITYIGYLLYLR